MDVYIRFAWWQSHRKQISEGMTDEEGCLLEELEAAMTSETETSRRPKVAVLMVRVKVDDRRCVQEGTQRQFLTKMDEIGEDCESVV